MWTNGKSGWDKSTSTGSHIGIHIATCTAIRKPPPCMHSPSSSTVKCSPKFIDLCWTCNKLQIIIALSMPVKIYFRSSTNYTDQRPTAVATQCEVKFRLRFFHFHFRYRTPTLIYRNHRTGTCWAMGWVCRMLSPCCLSHSQLAGENKRPIRVYGLPGPPRNTNTKLIKFLLRFVAHCNNSLDLSRGSGCRMVCRRRRPQPIRDPTAQITEKVMSYLVINGWGPFKQWPFVL